MKTEQINQITVSILTIVAAITSGAWGQYRIDWYTFDGGGGISTGSGFELHGTIGQTDASLTTHSGNNFELTGGFWPGFTLCKVDMQDLQNFVANWLNSGANIPADLDNDNNVDLVDFSILHSFWLDQCPGSWPL